MSKPTEYKGFQIVTEPGIGSCIMAHIYAAGEWLHTVYGNDAYPPVQLAQNWIDAECTPTVVH